MGSHDSDPIDETVLLSEAPKEAAQSSPTDQRRSLASLVSFSSSKDEIESDAHFYPIHKLMLVSEAPKLEEESFCAEDCVSLFTEYRALDSGSDILHQRKETVEEYVNEQQSCMETTDPFSYADSYIDASTRINLDSVSGMCYEAEFENKDIASGLCGMVSDTKDDCCPESGISSEVESGVSRMCLNSIHIKNDRISSGLKPTASSLEYLQFSGHDSINTLDESQMASEKLSVFGGARIVEEGRVPFPNDIANLSVLSTKSVPESFTKCHEKTNSDHVGVPLAAFNLESSGLQHGVLNDQHVFSYVIEKSTIPSEHVRNLASSAKQAHSFQPCVPDMVLGSGSHSDLFGLEAFKLNGVLPGNRSVATADASCFADEGQEKAQTGVHLTDFVEASLRRSSRPNKFIHKAPNIIYIRKGSKKALGRVIDLLPVAVRSRRSCLNRSARLSKWGLFETLSKYIAMDTLVEQRSGSVKSGNKIRKKDMVQVGGGSDGSYARSLASSGHVRLKLKIVNKCKSTVEPNPVVGTDNQVVHLTGNGDNQLDLINSLKDVTQQASKKSLEFYADMNMYRSATSHENPRVAVNPVNKDLGATRMPDKYNKDINAERSFLDKDDEKSGVSADDKHLNSGTSPDSEVIQVPESQFPSDMVHHDDEMDYSKTTLTPAENAIRSASKTRRKKENKKEKLCDNGRKSDMAIRCDVGHESADLRNSKKLLPPAKAEGNRKFKSKSKASSTPRLDMSKSSIFKGDKWKLAGKHVMDDSDGNKVYIPTSGVVSEDVSGLPDTTNSIVLQIAVAQPRSAWVCCDECLKWRCIPSNLADIIDETDCRWTCKDNQDKAFADCSVPQEKSNAEINAELNISEAEEGHNVQLNDGPQQSSWMLIKSNIFLHRRRKTQTLDEIMVCHCKLRRDGKLGCGDECLNRMLNIECVQGTCPCGDLCANQQFQRQSYANLKWFRCGKKGYGLQVIDNITQGQFLIEYVGEVLELPNYESRLREYASKGHKHFYFMTLNGNEVIDACAKGNLGRFINHSCDPNCRTEKWMVNGEICIGIFAVRDIKKGEELTFDYNYVRVFGAAAKKCHCGSAQCRGYIGGDRLNNEAVVQGDSDEEFPEPVAVYENGEFAYEYNIVSKSCSPDVLEKENEDALLQNDIRITLDDKYIVDKLELSEKDDLHDSVVGFSQIDNSLEIVRHLQQAENADKTTLDVQQEKPLSRISECSVSPKTSHNWSLNRSHPESLSESVDTRFNRSSTEIVGGEPVHSKGRSRMKISRPLKSVQSKESSDNSANIGRPLVTSNKSQLTSNKLKKFAESSTKHRSETVEDKLNELLNNIGGICKQKDAFKGYLKLLVLTAASGDSSHHETIQSNKDLSMILDAILKTKSRTVLTDILNKNGLQMLHSLMKKCRGNFNKIPILRKLLKVFEFLAGRKILTLKHINAESPRPGVESFRDSMLSLTEYQDRKVHQIARNFRDNWIRRSSKKVKCLDKGLRNIDFKGAPKCTKLLGSHYQRFDQLERPLESMECVKQSVPSNHPLDSDGLKRSRGSCKRKSRWDQPAEPSLRLKIDSCNEDDERRVMEEDGPPGFSCPSFGGPLLSNRTSSAAMSFSKQYPGPLECPNEMPSGCPQETFNSGMPMGYGISLNMVQEFGTPQACTGGGWVIAPGVPFCPFPPLPPCPNPRSNMPNMIPKGNTHSQHGRGPYRPQRRRQKNFWKPLSCGKAFEPRRN